MECVCVVPLLRSHRSTEGHTPSPTRRYADRQRDTHTLHSPVTNAQRHGENRHNTPICLSNNGDACARVCVAPPHIHTGDPWALGGGGHMENDAHAWSNNTVAIQMATHRDAFRCVQAAGALTDHGRCTENRNYTLGHWSLTGQAGGNWTHKRSEGGADVRRGETGGSGHARTRAAVVTVVGRGEIGCMCVCVLLLLQVSTWMLGREGVDGMG